MEDILTSRLPAFFKILHNQLIFPWKFSGYGKLTSLHKRLAPVLSESNTPNLSKASAIGSCILSALFVDSSDRQSLISRTYLKFFDSNGFTKHMSSKFITSNINNFLSEFMISYLQFIFPYIERKDGPKKAYLIVSINFCLSGISAFSSNC